MSSSLININEATAEDLQKLDGIGPKRAAYIIDYREQVAPIRNSFDLAIAAGISVKEAERHLDQLDWASGTGERFGLVPAAAVTLATFWLILAGFDELAGATYLPPQVFYNLSLTLILLAGLMATGDISAGYLFRQERVGSRVSKAAAAMFAAGLGVLAVMALTATATDYPREFQESLNYALVFIFACLFITWLIYGPGALLRISSAPAAADRLEAAMVVYDSSLAVAPFPAIFLLLFANDNSWLAEIYAVWCLTILFLAGLEMIRGQSAFVSALSTLDQSRLRFVGHTISASGAALRKLLGYFCLAGAMLLVGTLTWMATGF